jgi:hypothetical protein
LLQSEICEPVGSVVFAQVMPVDRIDEGFVELLEEIFVYPVGSIYAQVASESTKQRPC